MKIVFSSYRRAATTLASMLACAGTPEVEDELEEPACIEHARAPGEDDMAFGMSISEYVASVEGIRVGHIEWLGGVDTTFMVTPNLGESELTVDVQVEDVRVVEAEKADGAPKEAYCIGRIETDLLLQLSSSDGALAESFFCSRRVVFGRNEVQGRSPC